MSPVNTNQYKAEFKKPKKKIGGYVIGDSGTQIGFYTKPSKFNRFFVKFLLGWEWVDIK